MTHLPLYFKQNAATCYGAGASYVLPYAGLKLEVEFVIIKEKTKFRNGFL